VIPPSVLVSELLDYVDRNYGPFILRQAQDERKGQTVRVEPVETRTTLVTTHPLQAFSRRYFTGDDRLFSYSQTLAHAASVAGRGTREPAPFLAAELPPPDRDVRVVDLGVLVRFFRNPARHLFERRLKIRLETAEDEIEAREPFELGGLTLFDLKQRLLDLRIRGVAHDGLALARAAGDLPHGAIGEVLYTEESGTVDRVAASVAALRAPDALDPIAFEMTAGELTLVGTLDNLSSAGMLDYRIAAASVNLRTRAWIRHLALNAFAPRGVGRISRCVTQDCVLTFAPVADARTRLAELLALYWTGLHRPLHFFPRTSSEYAKAGEVNFKVRQTWEGSGRSDSGERPESADPYYALAFRGVDPLDDEFQAAGRTVFGPMKDAVEEEPLG
jgi:exodeoxyribonuclease V gamma subunit